MGKLKVEKVKGPENNGFSETVLFKVLNQSNVTSNRNKWYCAEIQKHPDGRYRIFTHYGRVGISNIYEIRQFMDGIPITEYSLIEKEFHKIINKKLKGKLVSNPDNPGEKMREAYVEVDTPAPTVGSENICGKTQVVKKQASPNIVIDTSSYDPIISKLLDQLIEENIHNITSHTNITYTANGFSTSLGPVTQEHVDKARAPLDELNKLMGRKGSATPTNDVKALNSLYFSLIPKPFSRKISEEDMILDAKQLELEYDILDQLATGLQMGSAMSGNTAQRMNALGTEIEILNDLDEVRRIKKYIRTSKASNHKGMDVWKYDVKTIFKVQIPEERARYESMGKKKGNIKEVFHGSSSSNCLSILKGGLIIPPTQSGHVTGRLNGNAVYGAIQSTKAMNYATGFWGTKRSSYNNIFLFLVDFAMGKTYETTSSTPNGLPRGYDSVWAKPGYLYNHELMVYKLEQQTIKYIVELTPGGK